MQSNLTLTDSHFHSPKCDFPSINAGCSADDLAQRIKDYSSENTYFAAAMGPWETEGRTQSEIDSQFEILLANIRKYNPLFIGETGLDYYWQNYGKPDVQIPLFIRHLELASELDKRVLIHCRQADEDVCRILKEHSPSYSGVIHCCDGDKALVETALEQGFYISFAGNLTYKSNTAIRKALTIVPKDRLLLETDSPYLSPVPLRGKPNCSENIIYTYRTAAEILNIDPEELTALVYANFRTFCTVRAH